MIDAKIKLTIPIHPVSKKNHQRIMINKNTGKPFVMPSEQYVEYEKKAKQFLLPLRNRVHIDYPVNVKCLFYMGSKRKVDLTNLLEAIDDVLVKAGILADDDCKIIIGHDGSRVRYDKDFPRTEIYISKADEKPWK